MHAVLFGLVLASAFAFSNAWKKISVHPICFQPTGDQPGIFQHYGENKLVKGLRLKWLRGEVRCKQDVKLNSRWGCYRGGVGNSHLNVVVTDYNNNLIYPKREYITNAAGLWYWLPGIDEKHSEELVFTDFSTPFYLVQGGYLKIWYGEDLKNSDDKNNQGQVCVDIYALFVD